MKKYSVLIEASPAVDSSKSGVGYYTQSLIEAIAKHNAGNITFFAYYFNFLKRANKAALVPKRIRTIDISLMPGKLIPLFKKIHRLPYIELFVPRKFDFIIFTNYVALPSQRQTPYALTVYDLGFIDYPEYVQEKNLKYLERFCPKSIDNASVIVTISEFTKKRLEEVFPKSRGKIIITPIPPAYKIETLPKAEKPTKFIPPNMKYILFVGTIEPRKNLANLVDAYIKLSDEIKSEYALVLAGGNGWKNEEIIETITKAQKAGENIINTGYISDKEKESLYAHASLFVLPSHYEGFGMPILEAMQYNIPCAVSDIEVFHEVASDASVYFDKDNPLDIANKINEVLVNEKLAKSLAQKGKQNLSKYSWDDNAKVVIESIERILKAR